LSGKETLRKIKTSLSGLIWLVITLFLFLLIWQLIITCTKAKEMFPAPMEVIKFFFNSFTVPIGQYTLFGHIGWSLFRVLVGFSIASILGCVTGLIMGRSRLADAIIKPIFEIFRPIPPIAWIPLAILWFGIGELTKYFIIFVGSFVPAVMNSSMGASRVNPVLVGAAEMLGANKFQVFFRVVLPSTVPSIFAGLQIALSTAWMVVLAAEMVRSSEGLGWMITAGMESGNFPQIISGMIAISIVGLVLVNLMRGVETWLCRWNNSGR
jgi:ABC-type nitrate/sulfonate/bicarbonate transport system permease component